jgi:hypothetical protein
MAKPVRFRGKWRIRPLNEKGVRESYVFDDLAEAKRKLKERESARARGLCRRGARHAVAVGGLVATHRGGEPGSVGAVDRQLVAVVRGEGHADPVEGFDQGGVRLEAKGARGGANAEAVGKDGVLALHLVAQVGEVRWR